MNLSEIKDAMAYGPALEAADDAFEWLVDNGSQFGHFIGGTFTDHSADFKAMNPANNETLATLSQATDRDIDAAVRAARSAQPDWAAAGGKARAKVLYALARLIQKNARLFAVLETLDNGKPLRETRDIDVPLVIRHFYHHAGHAQLFDQEYPNHRAYGVCAQIIPWNFPLLMLAWKVAPALAAGNAVVLKPAEQTSLTALLFAQICQQAGVPRGVVNIITGDGRVGAALAAHPDVNKVAFTGSTAVGRMIREATAGQQKSLTLELGGKSPFIVFDDADLDSAVEGVVDAIWLNGGQVCCAGSRLIVQESVYTDFMDRLKLRMAKLRVGQPMDKTVDIGSLIDARQGEVIREKLALAQGQGVFQPDIDMPAEGVFLKPTVIEHLETAHPLMQDEIFGPVLVTTSFRTPAEAVALANDTRYGLAASIWSENISVAMEIASKVVAGVVWINSTNQFDAAVGFGGVRESGYGREGGAIGLMAYCTDSATGSEKLGDIVPNTGEALAQIHLDHTQKLFIGGKQTRPDGGYSDPCFSHEGTYITHAARANRKDIRNAVEAAHAAKAWGRSTAHLRAQILYFMAENLSARADHMAAQVQAMTGQDGRAEVDASIDRLMSYAALADKFDGGVRQAPLKALVTEVIEPMDVVGVICPNEAPLLGLLTTIGATMSVGARVVALASEPYGAILRDVYSLLETSDVPAGVVNLLTGRHAELAPHLAGHMDVDALWCFGAESLSETIERLSATNLKRTWVNHGYARDWYEAGHEVRFLREASEVKSIWVPYGV